MIKKYIKGVTPGTAEITVAEIEPGTGRTIFERKTVTIIAASPIVTGGGGGVSGAGAGGEESRDDSQLI